MATLNSNLATTCSSLDADAIKEIIDTNLTDAKINNFINMAYYVTLPLSGKLSNCGGGDALCEIMLLLSAHFLTMYERQSKSESVAGEWSVTFMGQDGIGLDASLYGQQAKILDCSNTLSSTLLKRADWDVIGEKDLYDYDFDVSDSSD